MAAKININKEYNFYWKMENISQSCLLYEKASIESPVFIADSLQETTWSLLFVPTSQNDNKYFDLRLKRNKDGSKPESVKVTFKLYILREDDYSILLEKTSLTHTFKKDEDVGYDKYETRERVFVTERNAFVPKDILTVLCKIICSSKEACQVEELLCVRSVYKRDNGSFVWEIENFSTHKSPPTNTYKTSLINFDLVLESTFKYTEPYRRPLVLNINSFNECIQLLSIKTFLLDSNRKKLLFNSVTFSSDKMKRGVLNVYLNFPKNLTDFLQNDVLFLDFEYDLLIPTNIYEFFHSETTDSEKINGEYVGNLKYEISPVLPDVVKSMYTDSILCDVEILTSTGTFRAHRAILSSRSPVFCTMFSTDMKEKTTGQVKIEDLEDDTVQQMLMYIYTDSLEDLHLENACELYAAAEKYQILSLKRKCSLFLKDNLTTTKVCEVLDLADSYEDSDLKNFTIDYILKNNKEVFGSQEWKDFANRKPELAKGMQ